MKYWLLAVETRVFFKDFLMQEVEALYWFRYIGIDNTLSEHIKHVISVLVNDLSRIRPPLTIHDIFVLIFAWLQRHTSIIKPIFNPMVRKVLQRKAHSIFIIYQAILYP